MGKQPLYPSTKGLRVGVISDKEDSLLSVEEGHPALPIGTHYPVSYHEVRAEILNVPAPIRGPRGGVPFGVSYTYFPSARVGWIENIDAYPGGIGTKLLSFAIDDMKVHGITQVGANAIVTDEVELLELFDFRRTGKTETVAGVTSTELRATIYKCIIIL